MRADEPADHLGLGLTQLGELGGDVRHRAMVLAQLPAGGDRRRAGSVSLAGQRLGQCLGPGQRVIRCAGGGTVHGIAAALLEPGHTLGGEPGDGFGSLAGGDMPERGQGQVVVGVRKAGSALLAQCVAAGRPSAAPVGLGRGVPFVHAPLGQQRVEVAAYSSRRHAEQGGKRRSSQWPALQQKAGYPIAGPDVDRPLRDGGR